MNTTTMIETIKKHPLCKKNLFVYTWLSGSQTIVYPISIHPNPLNIKEVVLQWKSDKVCPAFMAWIKKKFENVKDVIFWKSDGSCPSNITIYIEADK